MADSDDGINDKDVTSASFVSSRSSSTSPEPDLEQIDPSGDVILHVIGDYPSCFLVSSKAVSLASKPFAAMLGPRYMEGQSLSVENPPVIQFPDDASGSFRPLMIILHHKCAEPGFSNCFQTLNEPSLGRLLVLADKYGCVEAVRFAVCERLRSAVADTIRLTQQGKFSEVLQFRYLISAMDASFITRDVVLFKEISLALMLRTCPLDQFANIDSGVGYPLFVPGATWTFLSEMRAVMRAHIFEFVSRGIYIKGRGPLRVKIESFARVAALISVTDKTKFRSIDQMLIAYGMRYVPLEKFATAIEKDLVENGLETDESEGQWTNMHLSAYRFAGKIRDMMIRFQGLCLDCAVEGSYPDYANTPKLEGLEGRKCKHGRYVLDVGRQGQE